MIFIVLILGLVLRFINIDQSLWLDEAITATIARDLSINQIFNNYLQFDNHPPFYLILIHFWIKLVPNSEPFLRLPSILFGVATIFMTYLICKDLLNKKLGLIVATLLATSPLHIYYSQENRMYSLNTLLVVSLVLVTFRYLKVSKNIYLFLYFFIGVILIYTDYLPILIFLVTTAYVLLSKKFNYNRFAKTPGFQTGDAGEDRFQDSMALSGEALESLKYKKTTDSQSAEAYKWVLLHIAIALTYIPWLPIFFKQFFLGVEGRNRSELFDLVLGKFSISGLPLTFEKFVLGRIPVDLNYSLIFILPALLFFFLLVCYSIVKIEGKYKLKIGLWILVPTFIAYFASLFLPVFLYFRLLFVLPAFYILVGFGILQFKKRAAVILLVICLVINLAAAIYYFTTPLVQREQWRQASSWLTPQVSENAVILFANGDPFPPFSWYYPNHPQAKGAFAGFYAEEGDKEKVVNLINMKNQLFVFTYLQDITDPKTLLQQWTIEEGYKKVGGKNFIGVGEIQIYQK